MGTRRHGGKAGRSLVNPIPHGTTPSIPSSPRLHPSAGVLSPSSLASILLRVSASPRADHLPTTQQLRFSVAAWMGTSGTSSLPFVSHLSAFAPPRESLVPSQTIEGNTSSQLGVGRCGVPRHTKHVVGVGRASVGSFLVGITPVNSSANPSHSVDG